MIRLLFIVPYPELKEKVEYVLSRHPERKRLNADVQVMTVENTPDVPSDEYDAVIARGYTPRRPPSASPSPVTTSCGPSPNAAGTITPERSPSSASPASCTR